MSGPLDLAAIVSRYEPDGDDASARVALEALAADRPMWRRSEFDPGHFTASGFVLSPDRSSILLIHHAKLKRWLQPGGHFEADDHTVESAARREIAEETGLTGIEAVGSGLVRIDAHPIPARSDEPAHTHIDLGVGFVATEREIAAVDEILDARWVAFDELIAYGVDEAVSRSVAALRERSGSRNRGPYR